jgi:proteic killer suppression protein
LALQRRQRQRQIFALLDAIESPDELRAVTVWKVHTLTGNRKGTWSVSVTRNQRLTFRIDADRMICDVNLEDYH